MTRIFVLTAAPILLWAGLAQAQHSGPDTCKNGFVWREANADDHVCVTPAVREQTRRDNQQARYRISATDRSFGNATCRTGYVWREATAGDLVCVTPAMRSQARADNAAAVSRYVND